MACEWYNHIFIHFKQFSFDFLVTAVFLQDYIRYFVHNRYEKKYRLQIESQFAPEVFVMTMPYRNESKLDSGVQFIFTRQSQKATLTVEECEYHKVCIAYSDVKYNDSAYFVGK